MRSFLGVRVAIGSVKHLLQCSPLARGNPAPCASAGAASRAYPRSRGATAGSATGAPVNLGLSPLARGNRHTSSRCHSERGPIPARAGQPTRARPVLGSVGAYPRSRGATFSSDTISLPCAGLSPLARGNLFGLSPRQAQQGPIPARAGQPRWWWRGCAFARAYPRSRGATPRLR